MDHVLVRIGGGGRDLTARHLPAEMSQQEHEGGSRDQGRSQDFFRGGAQLYFLKRTIMKEYHNFEKIK